MELDRRRQDVDTLCRTCLQALSEDALDISKHDIFLTPDVVKKLVLCTSLIVEPQDGYPKHLCDCCYAKVNEFHQFQTMCVESAQRFKELQQLPFKITNFEFDFEVGAKVEVIGNASVLFDEDSHIKLRVSKETVQKSAADSNTKTGTRKRGRPERTRVLKSTKAQKITAPAEDVIPEQQHSANRDAESSSNTKSNDIWETKLCNKEGYDALEPEHLENKDEDASHVLPKTRKKKSRKTKPNTENAEAASNSVLIRYACTQVGCARAYKNKSTLNVHLRIFHKLGPDLKTHICEICGKVFKHSKILNVHSYTHKDPSELPFPCELAPVCARRFARKDRLKTHMLRHAGVKNFVCPYCGMRKTTRPELKTHINYHTLERTWPCRFCAHVCNSSGNLKTHVRTMHERAKDFNCRYCERRFAKPDTRKYHEMTHTGEKPNVCKECGKRFTQPSALRNHQKARHALRGLDKTKAKTSETITAVVYGGPGMAP